jgi:acid phosphatase
MTKTILRKTLPFRAAVIAAAGTLLLVAVGCGGGSKNSASLTTAPSSGTIPQSQHVVLVMEENQSYESVVGNTKAWSNLNNLIQNGALATNYYADAHGSLPNYFMLTTGQTLTFDDSSTQVWSVDNMARRMLSQGVSFKVYAEDIKQGYVGGNTGAYVIRHNPFAMLSDVADNGQVADAVINPFTQFGQDLASGNLPKFSFIVPDINDDAHTGPPQQADAWLQTRIVQPLMNDKAFQPGGDGVLIVNFDESVTTDVAYGGGHVAPVFWGPPVKVGYQQKSSFVYQHESMLHTIMSLLSLSSPPGSAALAPGMGEFFNQ